jgi:hypothetical protein
MSNNKYIEIFRSRGVKPVSVLATPIEKKLEDGKKLDPKPNTQVNKPKGEKKLENPVKEEKKSEEPPIDG